MAIHSMASIPPSYYHASAPIPIANHSDFFNNHEIYRQLPLPDAGKPLFVNVIERRRQPLTEMPRM
jgi:hypothetical protein